MHRSIPSTDTGMKRRRKYHHNIRITKTDRDGRAETRRGGTTNGAAATVPAVKLSTGRLLSYDEHGDLATLNDSETTIMGR